MKYFLVLVLAIAFLAGCTPRECPDSPEPPEPVYRSPVQICTDAGGVPILGNGGGYRDCKKL